MTSGDQTPRLSILLFKYDTIAVKPSINVQITRPSRDTPSKEKQMTIKAQSDIPTITISGWHDKSKIAVQVKALTLSDENSLHQGAKDTDKRSSIPRKIQEND